MRMYTSFHLVTKLNPSRASGGAFIYDFDTTNTTPIIKLGVDKYFFTNSGKILSPSSRIPGYDVRTFPPMHFAVVSNSLFAGKSFCVTGAMPSGLTREAINYIIERHGGTIDRSVTKNTTYLIQERNHLGLFHKSTKTKAAEANGKTKIISFNDFLRFFV